MDIVLSSAQMKNCDKVTIEEFKVPSLVLMERAAMAVVDEIKQRFERNKKIAILCGCGNNGGDGLAVGRILTDMGYEVDIYLAMPDGKPSVEYLNQLEILKHYQMNLQNLKDEHDLKVFEESLKNKYQIVIDAVFGVGLNRMLSCELIGIIQKVNQYRDLYEVIAVDVPSGLDSDKAVVYGAAIIADITIVPAYMKVGLVLANAREYVGKLVVRTIGINSNSMKFTPTIFCNLSAYNPALVKRKENSHKGSFGKLLIVAGNETMAGACYLAAKAAYKTGVGLVYILTHSNNLFLLKQQLPECIIQSYNSADKINYQNIDDLMAICDVVLIGCGMGRSKLSDSVCEYVLLNYKKDKVLDADAINFLADSKKDILKNIKGNFIITPHLKEYSRLLNIDICEIQKNMLFYAESFSKEYGCISVVKSASTIVSDGRFVFINTYGNNGMATGGSGDVLSGIVASGISQAVVSCELNVDELWKLVCAMVELHSLAGDSAKEEVSEYSLMATDIINHIPNAIRKQRENDEKRHG